MSGLSEMSSNVKRESSDVVAAWADAAPDDDDQDLLRQPYDGVNDRDSNGRMVEDDLEDILRIPVAQALKPKRSHTSVPQMYLPTSRPSSSIPLAQDQNLATTTPPKRKLSVSPSTSPSPSPSPKVSRGPSKPAASSYSSPARRSSNSTTKASAAQLPKRESPLASSKSVAFPTSRSDRALPSASSAGPPASQPRVRAHTRATPSASASTEVAVPSTRKPPRANVKARRKSFSSGAAFEFGEGQDDRDQTPPWMDTAPTVYRALDGSLSQKGQASQMVLPAVARKLEAERLARLSEQGDTDELIDKWGRDGSPMSSKTAKHQSPRSHHDALPPAEKESPLPDEPISSAPPPTVPTINAEPIPLPSAPQPNLTVKDAPVHKRPRNPPAPSRSSLQAPLPPPKEPDTAFNNMELMPQKRESAHQDGVTLKKKQLHAEAEEHGGGCCRCIIM